MKSADLLDKYKFQQHQLNDAMLIKYIEIVVISYYKTCSVECGCFVYSIVNVKEVFSIFLNPVKLKLHFWTVT